MKKDVKEEFIEQALRYIEGIKKGPLSKSHAAHKKLRKICKLQCEAEDRGYQFFSELITHVEPAVRFWAASYLYFSDPKAAINELQSLQNVDNPHISGFAYLNLKQLQA
jgi:hypothetical protein